LVCDEVGGNDAKGRQSMKLNTHLLSFILCDVAIRHRMFLNLYFDQKVLVLGIFSMQIVLQVSKMQKTAIELCGALSALRSSRSV